MKSFITLSLFIVSVLAASNSTANQISKDFLKKEIELAHTQYLSGSSESGLYALQTLVRILTLDSSSSLQSELGPNNLSFTYLRIGLLHEQASSYTKAQAYFNKALNAYHGKTIELANLKEMVLTLDEKRN